MLQDTNKNSIFFSLKGKALGRKTYSVFICLAGGGSLFCELESSEKPNWVANSVGSWEWESLTENAKIIIKKDIR